MRATTKETDPFMLPAPLGTERDPKSCLLCGKKRNTGDTFCSIKCSALWHDRSVALRKLRRKVREAE